MNLFKTLPIAIIGTIAHLNAAMSPELATKKFLLNKFNSLNKYEICMQATINNKSIFDITLPLAEQHMSNQDIFNHIISEGSSVSYQGKQKSIQDIHELLLGKITGFIDMLKIQLHMFSLLMPYVLASQSDEISKSNESDESQEWKPESPKALMITDQNIQWAQEELIVESDFYIMHFLKINEIKLKPTAHAFDIWLQGLDEWWKQEEFNRWTTKSLNMLTKDRKASTVIKAPVKSILFFLSDYLPKTILAQDPTVTKVTWDTVKKQFPGFIIYENKNLFNFAGEIKTKQNISFLVQMINTHLAKIRKENPMLGKVVIEKEAPASSKKKGSLLNLFKPSN